MTLNNNTIEIDDMSISSLLDKQEINNKGIAVAVNNKVIKRTEWDTFIVTNNDKVVVITAAYGG